MTQLPALSDILSTYNLTEIQEYEQQWQQTLEETKLTHEQYKAAELLARYNLKPGDWIQYPGYTGRLLNKTQFGFPLIQLSKGETILVDSILKKAIKIPGPTPATLPG